MRKEVPGIQMMLLLFMLTFDPESTVLERFAYLQLLKFA